MNTEVTISNNTWKLVQLFESSEAEHVTEEHYVDGKPIKHYVSSVILSLRNGGRSFSVIYHYDPGEEKAVVVDVFLSKNNTHMQSEEEPLLNFCKEVLEEVAIEYRC